MPEVRRTQCARDCPDACFMEAALDKGKIFSVSGGRDNPVTNGFVCPRGVGDPGRVYSEKRVLHPKLREGPKPGGSLRQATWDEALDLTVSKLKETLEEDPSRVLLLNYSGNAALITSLYATRIWRAIGATWTDHSICAKSGHEALSLHYGLSYGLSAEELLKCKAITFWGFNAWASSPHLWTLAVRASSDGASVACVDPRLSETAEDSTLWLAPRPGTDVALAYGIARTLIEGGHVDLDFVSRNTSGYEVYREEALRWTPEKVMAVTSVEDSKVSAYADMLVERSPRAFMIGIGLQKGGNGAEAVRAVSLLPALLGEHRGFYYTNSRGRFIDYQHLGGEDLGECRVVSQVGLGRLLREGRFGFVWVTGMNPAVTLPDLSSVREGLSRGDTFVVVHDTHLTETCDYADVVLPAPTFLEKDDVAVADTHPYTRFSRRVIEPLGESEPESWVMAELSSRLELKGDWLNETPEEALARTFEAAFAERGVAEFLAGKNMRLRERRRDEYQTPSGRIEFRATRTPRGVAPLPTQLPAEKPEGWFTLLNSAMPQWTHSQFREVYGEVPAVCVLNPEDAAEIGFVDGEEVTLYNDLGEVTLRAVTVERVGRGVIWSPRPITDRFGKPMNSLVSGEPQVLGGGPRYASTQVKLRRPGK